MKRFLLLLLLMTVISCSSEENANDEMCCDKTVAEIKAYFKEYYPKLLENEQLTPEQRASLEADFKYSLEHPCDHYKKRILAPSGAPCAEDI